MKKKYLPMKKDAYYFPHDSNASQDEKILNLRADHGWEGYGVFWAVIERLRDTSNHKYRLDSIKGLAVSLGIKRPVLEGIIKNYDLFEMNEDYFWSTSLTRRMGIVEEKRKRAREAGKKSGEARRNKPNAKGTTVQRPLNDRSTTAQNQLNETETDVERGKERKGKEILTTTTTTREKIFEEKREQAREAGKKSGEARCNKPNAKGTTVQRPFNDRSTTVQNQLNETGTDVEQ